MPNHHEEVKREHITAIESVEAIPEGELPANETADDLLDHPLDYATKRKPVPCPHCKAKLERKIVVSEASANVGRPYVSCDQCSAKGKICFWFLDYGECDLCGCPMYQGPAKRGKHAGRLFEACSQGCPGKFRWLKHNK
jgi:hypothetical protein